MGRSQRLRIAWGLNAALVVAQVVVGLGAHSVGLIADAGHNLTDVAALTLSGGPSAVIVCGVPGGHNCLDPLVSLVIACVIAFRAVQLLGATTNVLLEATPDDVEPAKLVEAMISVPGVEAVHDLHTWS